jgi:hypothetical protein
MNRYDDRISRGRRSEYGRDEWRERGRPRHESARESFHPGNYGFEEGEYSARTAGDPDRQPYSRSPYGYYPGQDRRDDEWRGRGERGHDENEWRERGRGSQFGSQRFDEREPYSPRGDYSRAGPLRSEEWREDDDPERYGGGSRYSESAYGLRHESSRHEPWRGEWRESDEGRGRARYGSDERSRTLRTRRIGEGPFADPSEPPGYFGMGYYGDGGAAPTGGFDQRTRQRNYGSLAEDTFSAGRDWASSNPGWQPRSGGREEWQGRSQRSFRPGPKGYTRSDERVKEDICERLMLANSVDSTEVTVNVKDGQVTLEGSVPSRRMKHTIEDLVDATPGVKDIENRLRVSSGAFERGGGASERSGSRGGASSPTGLQTDPRSGSQTGMGGASGGTGSTSQRAGSQGAGSQGMGTSSSQGASTQGASTASATAGTTQGTSGSGTGLGSGQRRKE